MNPKVWLLDFFWYIQLVRTVRNTFFCAPENGIGEGDSEEASAPFNKQLFQDDVDDIDNELQQCQLKEESTASN